MNRLDRLHWILLAVIGLLLLMDAYLIVTPYRYFHLAAPHGLVRVNRFTGEAEKLWVPARSLWHRYRADLF